MAAFEVILTGTESVAAEIQRQVEAVPRFVGDALYEEGRAIIRDSQERFVPVDTGTLKGSAYVFEPKYSAGNVEIELGYGGAAAAYARVTHENPRAGKTGGVSPSGRPYKHWAKVGQWKYLEHPFLAAAKGMAERVAARVRGWQEASRVAR